MLGKDLKTVIYLIEDDDSVRQAMMRLLATAGYDVEAFGMAEAFLDFPFRVEDALLIIDIHLPGLDGLGLHERLQLSGMTIPVIFITAYDNSTKRTMAKGQGAAAYFRKPIDAQALLDAVAWALSSHSGNNIKEEERS